MELIYVWRYDSAMFFKFYHLKVEYMLVIKFLSSKTYHVLLLSLLSNVSGQNERGSKTDD